MDVGPVLGRAFSAWRADAGRFAVVFVLVNAPVLLFWAWAFASPEDWSRRSTGYGMIASLAGVLLEPIAAGATAYGAIERLLGRPVRLSKCLSVSVARARSLLGVAMRVWGRVLGLGVACTLLALLLMVPTALSLTSKDGRLGFELVGLFALLFPTLYVMCRYGTAAAVCIAERLPAGASMRRARDLQRGNAWPMLGVGAILWGSRTLTALASTYLLGGEPASVVRDDPERTRVAFAAALRVAALGQATELLFFGPLLAVAVTVAYATLRRGKEGVEAVELARVFD